jgi:hypothetical protein
MLSMPGCGPLELELVLARVLLPVGCGVLAAAAAAAAAASAEVCSAGLQLLGCCLLLQSNL